MGTIATTYSSPAHASVFDTILRVLLPFKKKSNDSDIANPTTSNPANLDNQTTKTTLANSEQDTKLEAILNAALDAKEPLVIQGYPSLFHVLNAEFLADRGDIDAALTTYKTESFKNDATSVFERALSLSLQYEPIGASLKFARAWQLQNPEHIPAQFYVAHLALKAYDYDLAGEILSQIIQYDPQADLSEILVGIYPSNKNDKQLLLQTLETLPEHDNPSIMVMQAGLMSQLGKPELALVSISQALKSDPDNAAFITLKADIIKQLKPYQDVLDYISTERKRLKNNKTLYLYEIRYRLSLKQTQQAWELLLEAHQLFQDDEITLLAALVSIDTEAYKTADDLLSSLASSAYYVDQAYYYLGISAERQHNYAKAARYLSKVTQEDLVLKARQKLVSILILQGKLDTALASLRKFSEQHEVYAPDSAIMQADILLRQGKKEQAKSILSQTSERFPDDTKLLFAQTELLDNKTDATLKRELLDHLIFLDPENPTYKIALAELLFDSGDKKNINDALQIAQEILQIAFDTPFYNANNYLKALNIMAANALAEKQYTKVIEYLESAYQVSPSLKSGIILLRAYQGLGQQEHTKKLLEDLQNRFALGQDNISNLIQSY